MKRDLRKRRSQCSISLYMKDAQATVPITVANRSALLFIVSHNRGASINIPSLQRLYITAADDDLLVRKYISCCYFLIVLFLNLCT